MSNNMIGAGGNVILGLFTLSLGVRHFVNLVNLT